MLESRLRKKDNEKYPLKEAVHKIIFPLRMTSDDVEYGRQNLWIIDERLTYHSLLSSDLSLNQIKLLESASYERPDIMAIFESPFVFVDSEQPFNSVVIVEFKRPMRKQYSETEDNPITQVYGYIESIKQNNKSDIHGRLITINESTRFYCYIICDLTPKMRKMSVYYNLIVTPDNLGYYGHNQTLSAYIEVIAYEKLLIDARKRNRVLFDNLNLVRT